MYFCVLCVHLCFSLSVWFVSVLCLFWPCFYLIVCVHTSLSLCFFVWLFVCLSVSICMSLRIVVELTEAHTGGMCSLESS
jgi:hypothetical protein